jgi:mono/diheme cytochrome c family protein
MNALLPEQRQEHAVRFRSLCAVFSCAAALISFNASLAQPLSPAEQRGLVFVQTHCAQCHAIGKVGGSPLSIAPPFRTLHLKYPIETLEEAFGEGITTGHPTMPEFRLDPDQINDVISYLKMLER